MYVYTRCIISTVFVCRSESRAHKIAKHDQIYHGICMDSLYCYPQYEVGQDWSGFSGIHN